MNKKKAIDLKLLDIKSIRESSYAETIFFAGYFLLMRIKNKEARPPLRKKINNVQSGDKKILPIKLEDIHIGIISDEMTYENFSYECQLYSLTPNNWRKVISENRIDLFLCESAWEGRKKDHQCWRGRIYKNSRVKFETRKELFRIIKACRERNIPTVFWNKEDPTYFDHPKHDFVDTALHFDYIFTTARECVECYRKKGHRNVGVLTFGFSPNLYNPQNSIPKEEKAVFAGSWFAEDEKRCKALTEIFDNILKKNIPLVIYDRQSGKKTSRRSYPEKYKPYIHPAISQKDLGRIVKSCSFAININTVTDSESMFARRVYELMASNVYVISNDSNAMEKNLQGRYGKKEIDIPEDLADICRSNVNYVFQNCTNRSRLESMLLQMNFPIKKDIIKVAIYSIGNNKVFENSSDFLIYTCKELDELDESCHYFLLWDNETKINIMQMIPHFSYIDKNTGIREAKEIEEIYKYKKDKNNLNTIFPISLLAVIKKNIDIETKKYQL